MSTPLIARLASFFHPDELDRLGLPRQWIRCDHCGKMSWRTPPHSFEPCPLVLSMSESAGLKMDAERSSALRAAVQMEEFMKHVQSHFTEEEDE